MLGSIVTGAGWARTCCGDATDTGDCRADSLGAVATLPALRAVLVARRIGKPRVSRNLVLVVLDSLRFDTFVEAAPKHLERLGTVERRWSYASWTAPSHHNLLMGLMPHTNPTHVYASEHYKKDFERYAERLDIETFSFQNLLPALNLPAYLRDELGYRTGARVSMPVLNPATTISTGFDDYRLMPRHNDFAAMLPTLSFDSSQPSFWMLNVGETHYPYATPDEDPGQWPRISGLHGVLKRVGADEDEQAFFDEAQMHELRARQVNATRHVDEVIAGLFDAVPPGTWIVVTSDHGELFGEGGFFGHGPIMDEKVYEVPFVEGRLT